MVTHDCSFQVALSLQSRRQARRSLVTSRLRGTNPAGGCRATTKLRLSALGLRRDSHGYVKQIHHEELEDGDKERPSPFPKVMLKQTDSDIQ
jgi:hypothetical protein